jgi:hypothetical protein
MNDSTLFCVQRVKAGVSVCGSDGIPSNAYHLSSAIDEDAWTDASIEFLKSHFYLSKVMFDIFVR